MAISLDLVTGESSGKDTLAFDHSQIILKAFNRVVNKMEHEPQVLQVLGKDFTITEARKVFAKFLGIDYKTIDHSNFKKAMLQYFDEIGERPVGIGRPSKSISSSRGTMNKVVSKRFRPNHSRKNAKTTLCELRFFVSEFDVFVNFLNKKLTIAEKARTNFFCYCFIGLS